MTSAITFLAPISSLASNGTMTVASLPSGTSTAASSGKASSIKGSMGDVIAVVMMAMALFGP